MNFPEQAIAQGLRDMVRFAVILSIASVMSHLLMVYLIGFGIHRRSLRAAPAGLRSCILRYGYSRVSMAKNR